MAEQRALPLEGVYGGSGLARLVVAGPASRLSLRAGEAAVAGLSGMLDISLPTVPLTATRGDGRYAFWLGPDEWLVIDEVGGDLGEALGPAAAPYSAVDISHRNVAIMVDGPGAVATLNAGSPLDLRLEKFPVGKVTRTVLGKAEIVLYRKDENTFRVECWRSFAPYVFALLDQGAKDAAF
ncbi:sarcosine oxidase subunit gamma [Martelella endophytica]|uniref:Sarcosine oxidase subunit gamma n=1 Tax=Martelella endophytica TaxID=1486262 RepID=A0A0D5LK77_MAREN|nr:sarcosine oxidase subunit gamma family protein [Martelella endophytica]AJY44599.1 sarcosine oxidase subunit gamma [Martelella endophytica]